MTIVDEIAEPITKDGFLLRFPYSVSGYVFKPVRNEGDSTFNQFEN